MAATRGQVLSLYKLLLKEGEQLTEYNFRFYAKRRVRDAFHDNKDVTDPQKIEVFISKAKENLGILKRQAMVEKLYGRGKLVIE